MTEHSISDSFIIRVYRVDTEDRQKITGLVEVMDGSGDRASFADMDELGVILSRAVSRPRKSGRKRIK